LAFDSIDVPYLNTPIFVILNIEYSNIILSLNIYCFEEHRPTLKTFIVFAAGDDVVPATSCGARTAIDAAGAQVMTGLLAQHTSRKLGCGC
jgi:hypothetical protein